MIRRAPGLRLGLVMAIAGNMVCPLMTIVHAQIVTKFQTSTLRPTKEAGALETEPDIAGRGDSLVAVWTDLGSGACGHRVGSATSTDGGANWLYQGNVPGTQLGFGEPSICEDGLGTYYVAGVICYNVIVVAKGAFGASGFAWDSAAVAVDVPGAPTVHRPSIACARDGIQLNLYLCYTEDREYGPELLFSQIAFIQSSDGGSTWTAPTVLSGTHSSAGRVVVGPDGEVYAIWFDHQQAKIVGRKSTDRGATFGAEFVVGPIADNQGAVPPGSVPEFRHPWYVDCMPMDRPSIAVDHTNGPLRGTVYVTWSERAAGTVRPLTGSVFEQEPNDSYAQANLVTIGQSFGGAIPSADSPGCCDPGDFFAFDGTAGTTILLSGTMGSSSPPDILVYRLECAHNLPQVQNIDRCNVLGAGYPVVPVVFTLPATGRYYIQTPNSAQPSRSYSFSLYELDITPGQAARDHRDVVLVSSGDGGMTWSPKVLVNDDPPRFDDALPSVAVDARSRVHVTWFDRRHTTDCGETSVHTRWAWSDDGGATFRPSVQLSSVPSDYWAQGDNWRVGFSQSVKAVDQQVYAVWSQIVGPADADVFGARIDPDTTTAVTVSGLAALVRGSAVVLQWYVALGDGIAGIQIHRSIDDGPWEPAPDGAINMARSGQLSEWEDHDVSPGVTYRYRLELRMRSGESLWEGPVEVAVPAPAERLRLEVVGPNPFIRAIEIDLTLGRRGDADVTVYDVAGKRVKRLYRGAIEPGNMRLRWDGGDESGRVARPGLYLIRVRAGAEQATSRIVKIE